jgi:hypothetical protein
VSRCRAPSACVGDEWNVAFAAGDQSRAVVANYNLIGGLAVNPLVRVDGGDDAAFPSVVTLNLHDLADTKLRHDVLLRSTPVDVGTVPPLAGDCFYCF